MECHVCTPRRVKPNIKNVAMNQIGQFLCHHMWNFEGNPDPVSEFEYLHKLDHKRHNISIDLINVTLTKWDGFCTTRCEILRGNPDPVSELEYQVRLNHKRQNTEKSRHSCKIWPPTKWDGLYTTRCHILRRLQICNQKFEIPSVAPAMNRFVFQPHFGKIWPHRIRSFGLVSGLIFQGESESEVRNFKFSL